MKRLHVANPSPSGAIHHGAALLLFALTSGLAACSDDDPVDDSPCIHGETDTVTCGDGGRGVQARICVDGLWEKDGECSGDNTQPECTLGATKTISCGEDQTWVQHQECVDGLWENTGECAAPSLECDPGDEQTLPCGEDQTWVQHQECVDGLWENTGECSDPNAVCNAGEEQTLPCGYNDRGEQAQNCVAGAWENDGTCDDPDECTDADERDASCGTNGFVPQVCLEGVWTDDGACHDPCEDGDRRTEDCGLNGHGAQAHVCVDGIWEESGFCDDPDECTIGEQADVPCFGPNPGQFGKRVATCTVSGGIAKWEISNACSANSIDMQDDHGCAVRNDGHVVCWGENSNGQLGNTTSTYAYIPVEVPVVRNARQVAVGENFSCALQEDQAVYCWGNNSDGQLGDGTTTSNSTPQQVLNLSDIVEISAGSHHACALDSDRTAYCWGDNQQGQLGTGDTQNRSTPQPVPNLQNIKKIVTGNSTTCALLKFTGVPDPHLPPPATSVYCWGSNTNLAAGINTTPAESMYLVPTEVPDRQFLDISLHAKAFCGTVSTTNELQVTHEVECIGGGHGSWAPEQGDSHGQNGLYTTFHGTNVRFSSSVVNGSKAFPQLMAGGRWNSGNVCVLLPTATSNQVWCWGINWEGALGRGYQASVINGVSVPSEPATPSALRRNYFHNEPVPVTNVGAMAVGRSAVCLIHSSGQIECTGKMSSNPAGYISPIGPKP